VNYKGDEPFGSAPKGTYRQRTTPVGSMGVANGFGLYDMHGNVAEWCLDYGGHGYDRPPDSRPFKDEVDLGLRRACGGSWFDAADASSAAASTSAAVYERYPQIGFRLVESNIKAPFSETAVSEQVSQRARHIVERFLAANKDYHLLSLADVPGPVLDEARQPRQDPKDPPALDLQQPDILEFAVSEGDADWRSTEGYAPDGTEPVVAVVVRADRGHKLYSVVFLESPQPRRASTPTWVVRDSNSFIATAYFIRGTVYTNDRFRSEETGGEEKYLLPGVNAYSVEGGEFAPISLFSLPDSSSKPVRTFKATATDLASPAYALRIISIVPAKVHGVRWYKVEALRFFPDRHTIKTGLVGFVSGANLTSNDDW
jgi:hypothetical protein